MIYRGKKEEKSGRRQDVYIYVTLPSGPAKAESIFLSTIVLAAGESSSPPK